MQFQSEAESLDHTLGVTAMNTHSKAGGESVVSSPQTMTAIKTGPSWLVLDLCPLIPLMVLSGIPGYQTVICPQKDLLYAFFLPICQWCLETTSQIYPRLSFTNCSSRHLL